MSKLISGKEALIALANGEAVQVRNLNDTWYKDWTDYESFKFKMWIGYFTDGASQGYEFRLKPRTITINGVELAPCYAVGIDHIKNEVSIQFNNNEDAVKLNNLLLNIYGFRNA